MAFVYYPPENIAGASGIEPEELRHKYYVQLAPDDKHLVPGILQQRRHGATGKWLEAGRIVRDLPERYFVQYTDFDTLVPGSLIQGKRRPMGKWKEVVKGAKSIFHRVYYPEARYVFNSVSPPNTYGVYEDYLEIHFYLAEVLPYVYPGVNTNEVTYRYKLYFFRGSFEELDNDASKLILFSTPGAMLVIVDIYENDAYMNTFDSQMWDTGRIFLTMNTNAEAGSYCFVLGILNDEDEVVDYIVMENKLVREIP